MKSILLSLAVIFLCYGCNSDSGTKEAGNESSGAENNTPVAKTDLSPSEIQIRNALLAAPEEKRDACTVFGFSTDHELTVLREGTNELFCLADDPDIPGFSVACYHKDLEPFMKRGRELKKQGIKDQALFEERGKEVETGTLKMPAGPTTLYVYSAKEEDYDPVSGEVKNGYLRYVVYIPYATTASTGLPEKPSADGMPWIMNPGTYRAHIMINP